MINDYGYICTLEVAYLFDIHHVYLFREIIFILVSLVDMINKGCHKQPILLRYHWKIKH